MVPLMANRAQPLRAAKLDHANGLSPIEQVQRVRLAIIGAASNQPPPRKSFVQENIDETCEPSLTDSVRARTVRRPPVGSRGRPQRNILRNQGDLRGQP